MESLDKSQEHRKIIAEIFFVLTFWQVGTDGYGIEYVSVNMFPLNPWSIQTA